MMTVGVILWVLFLVWLVSSLYPSQEMRHNTAGNYVYYILWLFVFGSVLLIQYRILTQAGYSKLAMESDLIGIGIGALRLWVIWRFMHNRHSSDDEKTSGEFPRTHRSS